MTTIRTTSKKYLAAVLALLCAALLALMLAGCGGNQAQQQEESADNAATEEAASDEAAEDEENYDTGDASKDDPLNQDGIGPNELLVASFGTSYNDNRVNTIGAIEKAMIAAFPDWSVRRGFTAQIIIDHVKKRDGEVIDNYEEALQRAIDNKVENLVVQPTTLMNGYEYTDLKEAVDKVKGSFKKVALGEPVLTSDEDFLTVMNAIVDETASYDDGQTAIVFMGHGTEADSNSIYQKMQDLLTDNGHTNYFVGTVEATPSLDDVLAKVKAGNYKKVVLEPLMIVAGDHANNDMAGDDEDSWKSQFTAAGFEVQCVLRGLGEMPAIQDLLVEHAQAAIDSLDTAQ